MFFAGFMVCQATLTNLSQLAGEEDEEKAVRTFDTAYMLLGDEPLGMAGQKV